MLKKSLIIIFCFLFTSLIPIRVFSAQYPILYVSPQGNDSWSGTIPDPTEDKSDGPFKTLEKGRDKLRELMASAGKKGGVVLLRKGRYELTSPLEFNESDSGSSEFPVVWQSYKGEEVYLIGGKEIQNFETFQGNIYKAKVENIASEPRILIYNGKLQTLARWPDKSEEQIPGGIWAFITNVSPETAKHAFQCSLLPDNLLNIEIENLEVATFSNYNWAFQIAKVKSIKEGGIIDIDGEFNYEAKKGRRFFLQNHIALLDTENEWYFDKDSQELYFYIPIREQTTKDKPILATLNNLMHIKNAKYLNFIGLNFLCSNDTGIIMENSEQCLVAKCSFSGIYKTAGVINGGKNNRIEGCDLFELGGSGISVNGGNKKTLEPGGHQIINNHIFNFAKIHKTYHPGISINGVANRIANNEIHDSPHSAIILGGNDHIIEYNRIYRVCQETGDAGAFYMGRDWTNRGNILRNNIFHDVYGFGLGHEDSLNNEDFNYQYETPLWAWGIYLDDCTSGVTVYGNIIYRIPLCGVMIGGGRDNLVENNIFVDCIPAIHIDARWDAYCWDVMDERLEAMKPKEPPYSIRYPELLSLYQDDRRKPANNQFIRNIVSYERDDFCGISNMKSEKESAAVYHLSPFDPETNKFEFNLIFHYGKEVRVHWQSYKKDDYEKIPFAKWQERNFDNSSIIANPLFLSPEKDDYWINVGSLALKNLKFQQIPIDKIGCYYNEFRRSWPIEKPSSQKLRNRKVWTVKIVDNELQITSEEFKPLITEEKQQEFNLEKFVAPMLTPGGIPLEQAPISPPAGIPAPQGGGMESGGFDPMKSLPPFPNP